MQLARWKPPAAANHTSHVKVTILVKTMEHYPLELLVPIISEQCCTIKTARSPLHLAMARPSSKGPGLVCMYSASCSGVPSSAATAKWTRLSVIVCCAVASSVLRCGVSCAARCHLNAKRPANGDRLRCGDTWRADSALLLMLTCVAVHSMWCSKHPDHQV